MNVQTGVAPQLRTQLTDGLQKRQPLNVAHSAANFNDGHIRCALPLGQGKHGMLDLVGNVRNDLHSGAQIVSVALPGDDMIIDGARGGVVLARHGHVEVAFVVAQIKVCFSAVVGHEHFAMLERVHGAGIHVDIGIQLLDGHRKAARLQQRPQRRGRQAFAQ